MSEDRVSRVQMTRPDFDDLLIYAVQSRPVLYDITHVDHKNKKIREILWKEIAEELSVSVDACENRWGLLRDRFVRVSRELSNKRLTVNQASTDWIPYTAMLFLSPYIQRRASRHRDISQDPAQLTEALSSHFMIKVDPDYEPSSSNTRYNGGSIKTEEIDRTEQYLLGELDDTRSTSDHMTSDHVISDHVTSDHGISDHLTTSERNKRFKASDGESSMSSIDRSYVDILQKTTTDIIRGVGGGGGGGGGGGRGCVCVDRRDECYHYAMTVAETLRRLPLRRRVRTQMKLNELLYYMEFEDKE